MEYSFDMNSEAEKFEPYYLKCICAGRAHEGFYIVYPSKCKGSHQKTKAVCNNQIAFYLQFTLGQANIILIVFICIPPNFI